MQKNQQIDENGGKCVRCYWILNNVFSNSGSAPAEHHG